MHFFKALPILCFVLLTSCLAFEVKTSLGEIRGKFELFGDSGVVKFLGIPYAEAPVDDLRFRPPVRKAPSPRPRDASRAGPICPQHQVHATLYNFTHDLDSNFAISEDCLYMNIYVPAEADGTSVKGPLAVMFYVHSGGWTWGSGNHYDGRWLAMHGKVIVVTFNYRLGILGFLRTDDGQIINNGFRDQVHAFEWVYSNIAQFDGDPERITVFGHSAGGISSVLLQAVPALKGKVRRVIALGGLQSPVWSIYLPLEKRNLTHHIAKVSGCNENLAECLRRMSVDELVRITVATTESMKVVTSWMPSPDSTLVDRMNGASHSSNVVSGFQNVDFMAAMASSEGTSLAYYIGQIRKIQIRNEMTLDEIKSLSLLGELVPNADDLLQDFVQPGHKSMPLTTAVDFMTDYMSWYPLYDIARAHDRSKAAGRTTYVFTNGYVPDDKSGLFARPAWQKGAVHGDELPLIFGTILSPSKLGSQTEINMATTVMTYITNFAKTGNPNGPTPVKVQWAEFTEKKPFKLDISQNGFKQKIFTLLIKTTSYWDRIFGIEGRTAHDSEEL